MNQGVVCSYNLVLVDETKISVLEISYRGSNQLLPGGSIGFLTKEEMEEAIKVVAKKLDWEIPNLKTGNIFKDVSRF